jgi:hypothetical protein
MDLFSHSLDRCACSTDLFAHSPRSLCLLFGSLCLLSRSLCPLSGSLCPIYRSHCLLSRSHCLLSRSLCPLSVSLFPLSESLCLLYWYLCPPSGSLYPLSRSLAHSPDRFACSSDRFPCSPNCFAYSPDRFAHSPDCFSHSLDCLISGSLFLLSVSFCSLSRSPCPLSGSLCPILLCVLYGSFCPLSRSPCPLSRCFAWSLDRFACSQECRAVTPACGGKKALVPVSRALSPSLCKLAVPQISAYRATHCKDKLVWLTQVFREQASYTLQQKSIYVFPDKKLLGLRPNFHILVSVSALNIPRIGPHNVFSCCRIGRPILEIYKSLTDT